MSTSKWIVKTFALLAVASILFSASTVWSADKKEKKKAKKDRAAQEQVEASAITKAVAKAIAEQQEAEPEVVSTHEELDPITIPIGETKAPIHTFATTADGKLLVSLGGTTIAYARSESGQLELKEVEVPAAIKVFDADGKLLDTWKLEVTPQAIGVAPDGTVFAGGNGRIVHLGADGKVLAAADAPAVADLPPLPEIPEEEPEDEATIKAKQEEIAKIREKISTIREEVNNKWKEIMKIEDPKERLAAQDAFQKTLGDYRELSTKLSELSTSKRTLALRARSTALRKRGITGIAVTKNDVFVACPQPEGYGYAIYRVNYDLEEGKKIFDGLRGCCGQLDIQANGDNVYVAENSRKRVLKLDRDGNEVSEISPQGRGDLESFGSCCNPMNIRFDTKGILYTAEASVGRIKSYTTDGEVQGVVVDKVNIVPGCKHVAIGVLNDGERVYMLDITRNRIISLKRK